MSRLFRKYHRWLAIIGALPLLVTTITDIAFPFAKISSASISSLVNPFAYDRNIGIRGMVSYY